MMPATRARSDDDEMRLKQRSLPADPELAWRFERSAITHRVPLS
jgi:hypothetical protein